MAKEQDLKHHDLNVDIDTDVDEFYFSALLEHEEDHDQEMFHLISDDKYAEELQFQEVLMGSVIISQMKTNNLITSSSSSSSMVVMIESKQPDHDVSSMEIIGTEKGQSSQCFCEICMERKESEQMFQTASCLHSFCSDCVTKHVLTKIQEPNNYTESIRMVRCPGENCKAVLELETCRPVLSKGAIDQWEQALCEELINDGQRFYCPFKDCSAMLVNDSEGEVIRESECPFCHRLFCARCYVPWHSGVDCEEFQSLNEDERHWEDLMVMELARDQKWSRCPRCRFFVERTAGCPHMTCRCKFQFCYGCGAEWTPSHSGCHRD